MSLNHPSGWSATCDMCFLHVELDDPAIENEQDARSELFDIRGWSQSAQTDWEILCPECMAVVRRNEARGLGGPK